MVKKYRISFTNKGVIICDSYEKRENGVSWINGTIQGYSTNDLVKKIEEHIIEEQITDKNV